ncbi:MAG: Uma2 family endonuclease [Chloroflexota bacterium]
MIQPTQVRITASDYFASDDYQNHDLIQLIDGEVIITMPPIPKHQFIVGEILYLLMTFARKLGGKAATSPIEVYLDENNVYEPDVVYLAPDSQCTVGEKRLRGAPELVVEVLSPGTARYDRQQKYKAYQKHGVKEYWIVDPVHQTIEVYVLKEEKFVRQDAYAIDDTFTSTVLDSEITVKPLFVS